MGDDPSTFLVVPATWEGVVRLAKGYYPNVVAELEQHLAELRRTPYSHFEEMAGFKFIGCRKSRGMSASESAAAGLPPHYSYEHFCTLPKPRTVWQMRAFLYCELHLLETFAGDGFTVDADGHRYCKEYLCPNVSLSSLESSIFPLNVVIPDWWGAFCIFLFHYRVNIPFAGFLSSIISSEQTKLGILVYARIHTTQLPSSALFSHLARMCIMHY